jgi:hypothetical protein
MMGLELEGRLLPRGSAAYNDVMAARRVQKYRLLTQEDVASTDFSTEAGARHYLELLRTRRTEQEVMRAVIVAAGKSPDPPSGWKEPLPGG